MSIQRFTFVNALLLANLIGLLTALPAQSMAVVPSSVAQEIDIDPDALGVDAPLAQQVELDPDSLGVCAPLAQEVEIEPNGLHGETLLAQEVEIEPNGLHGETLLAQEVEIDPNGLSIFDKLMWSMRHGLDDLKGFFGSLI